MTSLDASTGAPGRIAPPGPVELTAVDIRRTPILGLAAGAALGGILLRIFETGPFATAIAVLAEIAAVVCLAVVLPAANRLRLDAEGFVVRAYLVFSRRIAWSEVVTIEAGDGWSGGRVLIELVPGLEGGRIIGLPFDPDLDRHSLVDSYGLEADDLAGRMRDLRAAAIAAAARP
jgi:hypothetical protein